MLATRFRIAAPSRAQMRRAVSTLSSNPHIRVFPSPDAPSAHLLTYLDDRPRLRADLAIGTTTAVPPTPGSFRENRRFLDILNEVLAEHAPQDPDLQAAAQAFASPGGGFGFVGGSGASGQGGAGGAGVGGWVHLSDRRNPPDFGRIAWPEDIFGSVEVDGRGAITGNFQPSGTYRIVTNEGVLGLSPFLTERLVARLRREQGV